MSTAALRLEADDPAVVARTMRALEASADAHPVALRCADCGTVLARVGTTGHGPLFTSSWAVPEPLPWVRVANGVSLSRRQTIAAERASVVERSGPEFDYSEVHGVIALLALPPAMVQDYPDLLVRCAEHGAAVLDRRTVLEWMHAGRARKVVVGYPLPDYRPPRELPGGTVTHSRETRRPAGGS